MAYTGGPIESISIDSRLFPVSEDTDAKRDLGGFSSEVALNGDGTGRIIQTRKPWKIEGLKVAIDDDRSDQEFLQEHADDPKFVPITITLASGVTYGGSGIVSGDISSSSKDGTCEIMLQGQQKLEQQ